MLRDPRRDEARGASPYDPLDSRQFSIAEIAAATLIGAEIVRMEGKLGIIKEGQLHKNRLQ